jgi:hypothetical protein
MLPPSLGRSRPMGLLFPEIHGPLIAYTPLR